MDGNVERNLVRAREAFGAGRFDEASRLFNGVLAFDPSNTSAQYYLGVIAGIHGDFRGAIRLIKAGIDGGMDGAIAHFNLAAMLHHVCRYTEAREEYLRAISLDPSYTVAINNLADIEYLFGKLTECEALCRRVIGLDSKFYMAYNNLGNALKDQGRYAEAAECYRNVLQLKPGYAAAFSNLLLCLCYDSAGNFDVVCGEHREFGRKYNMPPVNRPPPDTSHSRKLRVGYVSADFRNHSVAYFVEPILEHLDHTAFEVYCYSDVVNPDSVTLRLQGLSDVWRETWKETDDRAMAQRIAEDRIDILVDLHGHSAHNRLTVFARRPAPVQVTHIGYPLTTGLAAMDYRITDVWSDPEGEERYFTERLFRLDSGFLCYHPPREAPPVREEPPIKRNGHITFGSFNNMPKLGPAVISLWAQVLMAVPGSKLMLKTKPLNDAGVCQGVVRQFKENGIDPLRLILLGHSPSNQQHLACYGDIDIALDTFPYNGTTTTCEALWMGVPVVALEGRHHPGRVAQSILTRLGLRQMIASSEKKYVDIASFLGGNIEHLMILRKSLRPAMAKSPLCDGPAYAACLGKAYQKMWQDCILAGK